MFEKGSYSLLKAEEETRIYHVVKYFRRGFQEGYKLEIGDSIRFGAVEFIVREWRCNEDRQSYLGGEILATRSSENNNYCRICCSEENSDNNPLVSLCKCSGSIKFIHVTCIKLWLKSKTRVSKNNNSISYKIKNFECELCKTQIPSIIQVSATKINLIDLEKPTFGSYIILESTDNKTKQIHLIYSGLQKAFAIRLVFFEVT